MMILQLAASQLLICKRLCLAIVKRAKRLNACVPTEEYLRMVLWDISPFGAFINSTFGSRLNNDTRLILIVIKLTKPFCDFNSYVILLCSDILRKQCDVNFMQEI